MPPEPFSPKRVLIITDAWRPQVNGVVRTLEETAQALNARNGFEVRFVTPDQFRTIPLPSYPEIRLALFTRRQVARTIEGFAPDAVHIATEGTLGLSARRYCVRHGIRFSTAFHTRYPDYVSARFPVPRAWVWRWLRWFHRPAVNVMTPTATMQRALEAEGFANAKVWSRGVDQTLFRPRPEEPPALDLPRPIWLNVGRLAVEKNLESFLTLDLPGTKVLVGDGPQAAELKAKYPNAVFLGARFGEDLARVYASVDVFVFPSRTDTFGLVILEALASGLPVAAYPVQGPIDILAGASAGVLDEDLGAACRRALAIPHELCRSFAARFTWDAASRQFLNHLAIPDLEPFEIAEADVAASAPSPIAVQAAE
ncbi:MAG: glycosyltransferase family 1 protein [Alphaproteobacteria bacterium]|nr:glycosyltransferase family 1 protein [Alphaproteobacteria bacterium]